LALRASYEYLEQILICNVLEKQLRDKYWSKIRPGQVVLDIGAAWGCYTFPAAMNGAYVYAFEPRADAVISLRDKSRKLGLEKRCSIIQLAVTDTSDQVIDLNDALTFGTRYSILDGAQEARASMRARTITIDDAVDRLGLRRVDWIKVDIEGAEILAINGGSETLQRFCPNAIIESHVGRDPNMTTKVISSMSLLCPRYRYKIEHNFMDWLGSYHLFFSVSLGL
jgi:FkbM family methyltransferase